METDCLMHDDKTKSSKNLNLYHCFLKPIAPWKEIDIYPHDSKKEPRLIGSGRNNLAQTKSFKFCQNSEWLLVYN